MSTETIRTVRDMMLTSWHIMPTWVSVFSTARYTQWEWGWLGGYSTGLVVERSWICRSPRRSGGRLSSQSRISWLSVLTYFGIRCSPGHSAKSAGCRSELDWYICTLPMWLCELKWQCKLVHGCISTQNLRRDGSSFMWQQPCNNQTVLSQSTPLRWPIRTNAL